MSEDSLSLHLEAAAKSYVAARHAAHSMPLVIYEMHSFLGRFGLAPMETLNGTEAPHLADERTLRARQGPMPAAEDLESGKRAKGRRREDQRRASSIRSFTDSCDGGVIEKALAPLPPDTRSAVKERASSELARQMRWGRGADPRYDLNRHAALARIVAALER